MSQEPVEQKPSIPLLTQLNLTPRFELSHQAKLDTTRIEYSDSIPLSRSNFSLRISHFLPPNDANLPPSIGLFITDNTNPEQPQPVSYVVFSHDNSDTAGAFINYFRNKYFSSIAPQLPQDLVESVKQGDTFDALLVHSQFQHQNLGKITWLLGLAYLQLLGIKQAQIQGDITITTNGLPESFYGKHGAKVIDGIETVSTNIVNNYQKTIQAILT
jgi:hypothetical protein